MLRSKTLPKISSSWLTCEPTTALGGRLPVPSRASRRLRGAVEEMMCSWVVLIGITLAAVLDWSAVLRLLPQSLTGAGVAGSVAFSIFPQMVASYREIVDAQAMRGYELRGPGDYLNLAPLLLAGGIERAVTMSELLESRGTSGKLVLKIE